MRGRRGAPVISAVEYGRIDLPTELDKPGVRERLLSAGLRAGKRVFEVRGHRLYAQGVVGVVDVGDVVVEILPKTADNDDPSNGASFLGSLLRFVGDSGGLGLAASNIATGDSGLLEVVLAWAVRVIGANLREGPPRRYQVREEISAAVRGRVELRHVARQRPGRAFEVLVRYAPLSEDSALSRIVKWLLAEIRDRTRSLGTRSKCLQLLQSLTHVADVEPNLNDLDRLVLTAMEDQWHPAVDLARTFLTQGTLDPARGGSVSAVAILFTLHDLFERAVRRVLREGLALRGFVLQKNAGHLLTPSDHGARLLRLRPDFRIASKDSMTLTTLGDAKWKSVFDGPLPSRLAEADAYQVVAYMAALRAEGGFIVCPLSLGDQQDFRHTTFSVLGVDRPLLILGVRLPKLISDDAEGALLRQRLCDAVVGI